MSSVKNIYKTHGDSIENKTRIRKTVGWNDEISIEQKSVNEIIDLFSQARFKNI